MNLRKERARAGEWEGRVRLQEGGGEDGGKVFFYYWVLGKCEDGVVRSDCVTREQVK